MQVPPDLCEVTPHCAYLRDEDANALFLDTAILTFSFVFGTTEKESSGEGRRNKKQRFVFVVRNHGCH